MVRQQNGLCVLRFLAGRLCLDFVNSIENRAGNKPDDFLTSYSDVVRWGQHRDLLSDADAERLLTLADQQPGMATVALDVVLALRETLHRVFLALAREDEPAAGDLGHIQGIYGRAIGHARFHRSDGRFEWTWPVDVTQLDWPLWPIAHSAVKLLTEGDPERVKVCANPDGCGWLFYDGSKNGSRRWCSMEGCGSQVKMRRQYAKQRNAQRGARDVGDL